MPEKDGVVNRNTEKKIVTHENVSVEKLKSWKLG